VNLTELQERRNAWVAHNFPEDCVEDSFEGMVEEMGELARARLKMRQGIRGAQVQANLDKEADAVADLVIFAAGYCSHRGWDFGELVRRVWEDEVEPRDWVRFPGNGRDS
jgi:NTP pyrophosphatase (non-canonical NTP hydrolase)